MSTRPSPASAFRLPALLIVAAFVVGAVALDRVGVSRSPGPTIGVGVIDGPIVPPKDAASVAWYCAAGTSNDDGRASETIIIGNLATEPIDVTITVMRGANDDPVSEQRTVGALAQDRIEVADLVETDDPGVIVEVLGGPAVVEHEIRGPIELTPPSSETPGSVPTTTIAPVTTTTVAPVTTTTTGPAGAATTAPAEGATDVAVGPCAREPASDWYFAGGTTVQGSEEFLSLFNPFGEDAIVDVSFLTNSGFDAPGATQALPVPRRSRVQVAVHEQVRREDNVGIHVHARTGRVVAERLLRFDGTDGRAGVAVSLGGTGSAPRWRFPVGDAQVGAAQSVSIANFAAEPAEVDVGVRLDGEGEFDPETVDVPAHDIKRVKLSERVASGAGGYSIDVRVKKGPDVVVEMFGEWASPATVTGVATSMGSVTTAKQWAFAVGRIDEAGDTVLTAINVSDRPLTVELYAYTAGDPNSPKSAPARAVEPGERAVFSLAEIGIDPEQVIVLSADGSIIAGRLVLTDGASCSAGIPNRTA